MVVVACKNSERGNPEACARNAIKFQMISTMDSEVSVFHWFVRFWHGPVICVQSSEILCVAEIQKASNLASTDLALTSKCLKWEISALFDMENFCSHIPVSKIGPFINLARFSVTIYLIQ